MIVKLEVEKCPICCFDFFVQIHLNGELAVEWCAIGKDTAFNKTVERLEIPEQGVRVFHFHLKSCDPILVDIRSLQRSFEHTVN